MTLVHWIIPNAGLQAFELAATAFNPQARTAQTAQLTQRPNLQESQRLKLDELSLNTPAEILYAQALGLPTTQGQIPWAAWETHTLGQACAWLHPCHLAVGMTDMVLQPVHQLQLSAEHARQLYELIAPYFAQDGMTLHHHSPTKWLVMGDHLAHFACASLQRVQGRSINEFLPEAGQSPQMTQFARLQAELQMLLYNHPINDERAAQGLPSVNSLWLDGAGWLAALPPENPQIQIDSRLQTAAYDPSTYAQAWASLIEDCQPQLSNPTFTLSLCGETKAISLQPRKLGFLQRLRTLFAPSLRENLREML